MLELEIINILLVFSYSFDARNPAPMKPLPYILIS